MAGLTAGALGVAALPRADACGCFTPPDPTVPVVQAGERLLFSTVNGEVTAHIQIQYAGDATDFGWLLPLPSLPTLELGTDEVFNQLIAQTQPKYRLKRVFHGNCQFPRAQFGGVPSLANGKDDSAAGDKMPSLVVIQASVGPYDYAVLRGDSKQDMLAWLAANRYFVPVGTDDVVANYVHPGAFFLALKLHPGAATGDLQPVVVHYASDLPMIPIVLSSVAAQKNMGIQVWMLGAGRAIPRNYFHTVLDDAAIDWQTAGTNYNDVIIRAANEAPGHHTFVTEYAGTSAVMKDLLAGQGRFGDPSLLAVTTDPIKYVELMAAARFGWSAQVTNILSHYIPMPSGIGAMLTPAQFYQNVAYWLGPYKKSHPQVFERVRYDYDPKALTDELFTRVVKPTRTAAALFDAHPYLTRLYTTLSPEDMNRDPVFSYNPSLPDVPNVHEATLTYECGSYGVYDQNDTYAWLRTADGFTYSYPTGVGSAGLALPSVPASRRIEMLRETGAPEVVSDNSQAIAAALGGGSGCSAAGGGRSATPIGLALAALFGLMVRRRRGRA